MQTAAFRQLLLRPPAHKAQEPQLLRKLIPCFSLHRAISVTQATYVYSVRAAKRWRYPTTCSAFVASFLAAMLLACTSAPPTHGADLPADIGNALARTCSTDSDCAAIGIGARACGGPADYLIYSRRSSDVPALTRAVNKYNAQRAHALRRSGAISTCEAVTPPGVSCRAGMCAAHPAAVAPQ